jgi:cysteine-rich repeat protein
MRLRFLLVLLVLLAPGCVGNFDPALYMTGGVQPLALGDYCTDAASVPTLARAHPDDPSVSVTMSYAIDTRGLISDVSDQVSTCTSGPQDGNDGFLRVHMNDGERWHFHIRHPDNGMSPSIYVFDSACDIRGCPAANGLDLCGAAADEHYTFVATGTGDRYVGIDAKERGTDGSGGFAAQLDVIHPVCGNGTREHSEGCDPGPDVEGDDCDASCRVILTDGEDEVEANDDFYAANHIVLGGTTTSVNGGLATACESDIFAFDVAAPMDVTIDLALQDGGCPGATALPLSLEVLLSESSSSALQTVNADGSTCPSIVLTALAAGTHFIRLRSVEPGVTRNVPYRLTITTP